ncbi:enhanced ethylene response protein 5, partial [Tanacetum coccineum]
DGDGEMMRDINVYDKAKSKGCTETPPRCRMTFPKRGETGKHRGNVPKKRGNVFKIVDAYRLIRQEDKYSQYAKIVAPLFQAMRSYRVGHFAESYQAFEKPTKSFGTRNQRGHQKHCSSIGKTPEKLKAVGSFLMKVFGVLFPEIRSTVVDVQKVADEDHVMNEAQEDVDVVVVEEGLQVKDGNKDGVSVKLSLACSDGQNLLTELTLLSADNEPDKVVACSRADEVTCTEETKFRCSSCDKYSSKPAVVTYTEPEVIEIDTGVPTVKVEPVSPPTTDDTGNLQEDQGLTDISLTDIGVPNSTVKAPSTGEPQTYVEHNVLHVELEGEGMDIDEVLRWKDEIPGPDRYLQVGEQKVGIAHPRDITHSLDNELFVSLQQLKSHPWWPGQIFDPPDALEQAVKHHKKYCFLVAYFGDQTFDWNESVVLKPFRSYFS